MITRGILVLLAYALILSMSLHAADSIDPEQIKLSILEPHQEGRIDSARKLKVRIGLKQPDNFQRPDFVLVVLGDGKRKFSEWFAKQSETDRNIYEFEMSVPVVKGTKDFEVHAEAAYTTTANAGGKKRKTIRIKSEPVKVKAR